MITKSSSQLVLKKRGTAYFIEELLLTKESTSYAAEGGGGNGTGTEKVKYDAAWRPISKSVSNTSESTVESAEGERKETTTIKYDYAYEYVGETRALSKATKKTDGVVSAVRTLTYQ